MKPSSKNAYTRFIPREEVGDVTQWRFGAVGAEIAPEEPADAPELPPALDQAALDAAVQQARNEAFAQGHAQGTEEATQEWQRRLDDYVSGQGAAAAEQFAAVASAFAQGLAGMQQEIAHGVLELACEVARHVLRRELQGDALALQPVITEALGTLVADGRPVVVRLNPADAQAMGPSLAGALATATIQWVADAEVSPGGCLVEQAGTMIDGRLEKRWQRALAPLGLDLPWRAETGHASG